MYLPVTDQFGETVITLKPSLILSSWNLLSKLPLGKKVFSILIGQVAPYSGSIRFRALQLEPGKAVVEMQDRRRVRNHLNSIHAMALVNLAEIASGLAMMAGIPDNARGIVTKFTIEYSKKARGTITAKSEFETPKNNIEKEYEVDVTLQDSSEEVVATAKAQWLIGPIKV